MHSPGTIAPLSPLHIKQSSKGYPVNNGELHPVRSTSSNYWVMRTDFGNDIDLNYNGVIKGYPRETDGVYVDTSDIYIKKTLKEL